MRCFEVVIVGLAMSVTAGAAGAQTQDSPIVQVGVFKSLSGNREIGSAYTTGEEMSGGLRSLVYVGRPCSLGAGLSKPPAQATYAWRIAGQVLSSTPDEAVIQLEWQRVLSEGQPVTSPGGSVRLTLRAGEHATLDSVNGQDAEGCQNHQSSTVSFEARFAPSANGDMRTAARFTPFSGAGGAGAGSGSAVAGSGGARGGGGRVTGNSSATGGGAGARSAVARATATPASAFDVELWLVHSVPNREDEILYQSVRTTLAPVDFKFAPIKITTPQGELTASVLGSVAVTTTANGNRQLVFATDRRVTFIPRNRPARDQTPETQGGGRVTSRLPGPDEVLSFEMPPLRAPNGGPSVADEFSVRLRLRPAR